MVRVNETVWIVVVHFWLDLDEMEDDNQITTLDKWVQYWCQWWIMDNVSIVKNNGALVEP